MIQAATSLPHDACQFEIVNHALNGIYRLRCKRCNIQLPSFDPPESTYFLCAAAKPEQPNGSQQSAKPAIAPPPLFRDLARRFLFAFKRWARAGFETPIPTIRKERKAACAACPLQEWIGPRGKIERCGTCKCWLPAKRWFGTEMCPDGRWPGQQPKTELVMVNGKLVAKKKCGCGGKKDGD